MKEYGTLYEDTNMREIESKIAEDLRRLVLEHRSKCDGDCDMSMILFYEKFYKPLVSKEAAKKHLKDFI